MEKAGNLTHALYVAAAALGRTRDAEEVVRVALTETQEATGVEAAALHLLQEEEGVLTLRECAALSPDAVLMDLAMPRMNGLEATRQIKTRWPDLAVVILTVHDEEVYRRTALAAGAAAFLEKKMLGVDLWPTLVRVCRLGQE